MDEGFSDEIIRKVTKAINGGDHGLAERTKFIAMTEEELKAYRHEQWNSAKDFIKNNPKYEGNKW